MSLSNFKEYTEKGSGATVIVLSSVLIGGEKTKGVRYMYLTSTDEHVLSLEEFEEKYFESEA